jgi:WD40 repeat protein
LTIEKILEEKKMFDLSVGFEKLGTGDEGEVGWRIPFPKRAGLVRTLGAGSNVLSVGVERWRISDSGENGDRILRQCILATTADRRLHVLNTDWARGFPLVTCMPDLPDSPILSVALLGKDRLLSASMSGQLVLSDGRGEVLDRTRDHAKYAVKVVVYHEAVGEGEAKKTWIATAGWDMRVYVYLLHTETSGLEVGELPPPYATLILPTNPESILFLAPSEHPTTTQPILLLSRRDSTSLHYYTIPSPSEPTLDSTSSEPSSPPSLLPLGTQNLAPHSTTWIAFTPSSLSLSPISPTTIAVATNTVPHMKLIIVKLLVPSAHAPLSASLPPLSSSIPTAPPLTLASNPNPQAAQSRAALATADRESAAILIHANTLAPQTPYSTPVVVWRPDGGGVWVNGDDGVIRGLDVQTGKVVATLGPAKGVGSGDGGDGDGDGEGGGHEVGSKVRCLWAGWVSDGDGGEGEKEEWLVSGGFDRRLIVWRTEESGKEEGDLHP